MDPRLDTYNWRQVFGEPETWGDGYVSHAENPCVPEPARPGSAVDLSPFTREDVSEVLHIWENHDDEWDGFALVRLNDGRFVTASGWCDYTGWG